MFMFRTYLNCIFHLIVMKNNNIINIFNSLKNLPYEFNISNTTFYKSITIKNAHCFKVHTNVFYTDRKLCFHFLYILWNISTSYEKQQIGRLKIFDAFDWLDKLDGLLLDQIYVCLLILNVWISLVLRVRGGFT